MMAELTAAEKIRVLYNRNALPEDVMFKLQALEQRGVLDQGLQKLSGNQQFISSLKGEQPVETPQPEETATPLSEKYAQYRTTEAEKKKSLLDLVKEDATKGKELGELVASMMVSSGAYPASGIAGLAKYVTTALKTGDIDKALAEGQQTMTGVQEAATGLIPAESAQKKIAAGVEKVMEVPGVKPTAEFIGSIPERGGDIAMKGALMAGASPETASSIGAGTSTAISAVPEVMGGMSSLRSAGKAVSAGTKAAEVAKEIADIEKQGVRVATSDVFKSTSRAGKLVERAAESTMGPSAGYRAAQQAERVDMIKDFARQYGADEAAPYIDQVYKDLDKTWSNKLSKSAKDKKEVINRLDQNGVVTVDKTKTKIDSEIARLKAESPSGGNDALIQELENFKTDIDGQSLTKIEAARKRLGNNLAENKDLAHLKDEGQKIAGGLYKDLNDEMGDFIQQQGGKADFVKWKVANKKISKLNDNLRYQTLRSVLAKGRQTPEDVRRLLMSAKPSEVKLLYRNLSPTGRKNAQMALIQEAVEKAGGFDEFTPDKFKNQLKRIKKQTGVFFTGDDEKAVEGIYKALKMTEQAGKAVAAPMTGMSNLPYVTTILGGMMGGYAGGGAGSAIGALALPMSLSVGSRVYNSRPVRNALIKLAYSPKGSVKEIENMKKLAAVMNIQRKNIEQMMEKEKEQTP